MHQIQIDIFFKVLNKNNMSQKIQTSHETSSKRLCFTLPLGKTKEEQINELQKIKDNSVCVIMVLLKEDDISFHTETLEFIQQVYTEADHLVKQLNGTYIN